MVLLTVLKILSSVVAVLLSVALFKGDVISVELFWLFVI